MIFEADLIQSFEFLKKQFEKNTFLLGST